MKKTLLAISLCYSSIANAQIITSVAGNSASTNSGDGGTATIASIYEPFACAFDYNGNFYFTEVGGDKVRKITTSGIISTFAGGGSSLGDGGSATNAQFKDPTGIAIDAIGNVYIADLTDFRVRKIDAVTNIISTIAGNGISGSSIDNIAATSASIICNNICLDGMGNIYLLDQSNRIRKINSLGIISTFAGTGVDGYSGDNGQATNAEIAPGIGLCTDNHNNIYFVQGNNIRKINMIGIITTIAGNGSSGDTGDGGLATAATISPYDLATDKFGNLFISGYISNIVRKINDRGIISTVAGNGVGSFSGDNGPATAAELHTPIGLALDSCGNLFIADRDDNHIRKVALNPLCLPELVDNVQTRAVNIYPNPTNDELQIDNIPAITNYCLNNIVGATMQHGTLREGNNTLSLYALPAGMYLLEMIDEEGNKTVKKIVKQ